ncbi:helix-turn-helix domain-containing protein [Mucilaginibacter sp. NFR10]|uniref:helix-turn-helix domain-containing protein n=1 Tax=Mucilaginibacter sp. NFR10 TaxID=1566292 RepID=UPI0008712582|nr:DNA binding domain-containing protein, excisionase family [Mucilaginibacter sp. NFR10]
MEAQYIVSKEGLKSALVDILTDLNIIRQPALSTKPPATRYEACEFLNISIPTLRKLIRLNQLPAFNIGRQIRINWSDLEQFSTQHSNNSNKICKH